jgi:hypothetical protein
VRIYGNYIEGTLSAALNTSGTTIQSAVLADLPAVASPDVAYLVVDPEATEGDPEIITVTAHTASATSATCSAATADHSSGVKVVQAVLASDLTNAARVVYYFAISGDAAVTTGTVQLPFFGDHTIEKVALWADTGPTGASLIVDANLNGTTIFTTQSHRPTITAGNTDGESGTPDVTDATDGDYLTIDVDQVGSSTAGSDITVAVVCWKV